MHRWLQALRPVREELAEATCRRLAETGSTLAEHETHYLARTCANAFLVALSQRKPEHFEEALLAIADREARAGNALRVEAVVVALDLLAATIDSAAATAALDPALPEAILSRGRESFFRAYLRGKAEEDERRARVLERYAEEAEGVPALVYSTDREGRITAINHRAAELLGYQPEDLIGSHYSVLMRDEDAERLGHFIHERRTKERATRRVRVGLRSADGVLREFEVSSTGNYDAHGEYIGTDGIARAVSDESIQLEYRLDPEGRFVSISESTAAALGYRTEELLGQHFSCLMDERERIRVGRLFGERRTDERAARGIRVILTGRNGVRREFEISAGGRYNDQGEFVGTEGLGLDRTSRTEIEREVAEGRRRYRRVLDAVGFGLGVVTPDLQVREANAWHQAQRRQPLVGMPCYVAFFGQPQQCPWCRLLDAFRGRRTVVESDVVSPFDGRRYDLVFSPLTDEFGEPAGVVEAMLDVTADRGQREALVGAAKRAALARLIGGMTRALAEPLTVLMARCAGDCPDPLSAGATAAVVDQVRRLQQLIGEIATDRGNPAEAVREALTSLGDPPAGISIETDLQPGLSPVALGHRQLVELTVHLLTNALEALPDGGEITIETLAREDGQTLLRVSDTGEGMTEAVLREAFDPFYTTRGGDHAGLGLSIVRGLVEGVGGSVRLDSSPGAGTSVEVTLPPASAAAPEYFAGPLPEPLRVAVLVAATITRQVLMGEFTRAGHQVVLEWPDDLAVDLVVADDEALDEDLRTRLLTAGANALVIDGVSGELPWPVLKRPFGPDELWLAVRRAVG